MSAKTKAQAAYRARAVKAGLCRVCCVLDARPGLSTCQRCHEAKKTQRARSAAAKKSRYQSAKEILDAAVKAGHARVSDPEMLKKMLAQ